MADTEPASAGGIAAPAVTAGEPANDGLARRNALILALAQGCAGFIGVTNVNFGGYVGESLAADRSLATLPITTMMIGAFLATVPMSMIMQRYGRRFGFLLGAGLGIVGGLLCVAGIEARSFWLFCLGTHLAGYYQSSAAYYRFAAADTASPAFRPTAIAWSLAGGLLAALVAPEILSRTRELWLPFAASYFAIACSSALGFALLAAVRIPRPLRSVPGPGSRPGQAPATGRPLWQIVRQPRFIAALAAGIVSFGVMTFVMTATPLAMAVCHFSPDDATGVIRWHVLAMYGPSFFTGTLIARFGRIPMALTGMALLTGCGLLALSGVTLMHFTVALIALGLGWNFAYISATTLVTDCHTPEERGKTQAFNDLAVSGFVAVMSFMSGQVVEAGGWALINLTVFPLVIVASALVLLLPLLRAKRAVAA